MQSIDDLYELYKAFTVQRKARGAISFEGDEVKFIFNADRKIDDIVPVERNDAHKLIEECMVAANVCAARFIEDRHAQSLFRVHAGPSGEKLQLFRNFLAPLGLTLGGDENPTPLGLPEACPGGGEEGGQGHHQRDDAPLTLAGRILA